MNGFWSSFKSTLDDKGRINFPAKFRRNLAEDEGESLILIRGNEKCIGVYPLSSWRQTIDTIRSKVRNDREFATISRRLMFQASEQKIDKQGRLNLPEKLIQYAQLNGEVLVVGYENKIEVWNPAKYQEYVEATENDYIRITEELDL